MNAQALIKEIVADIKTLPPKQIKTIADFVDFVKEKEIEEDINTSKKIISAVKKSRTAWKKKKIEEFISWEDIKKKYSI